MGMRNFIIGLVLLLTALPCYAAPANAPFATVWEKAAIGNNPSITQVNLHGVNGAIPATFETVWPESALYVPLLVAMSSPYCASSSANDAAAGTGARTIRVSGINTSFAAFNETVTMNGTSSVVLATANILLIHSMEVLTAGSGLLNAGIIQCGTGANTAGDPAVTHSYMPISSTSTVAGAMNKSSTFLYGVPAGKTLICRNIAASSVFATAASSIQIAIDGITNLGLEKRFFQQGVNNGGNNPSIYTGIVKFPEKTVIHGKLAGPTGSNTGPADLRAECILINNDYLLQPESVF